MRPQQRGRRPAPDTIPGVGAEGEAGQWRRRLLVALLFLLALAVRFHPLLGEDLSQVALLPERGERSLDPSGLAAADLRFVVWLVARNARTLLEQPTRLFQTEPCHPAENGLALGEPGITLGLLGTPAWALSRDPFVTFHFALLASVWVAGLAMYALVRAWTASSAAGVVAGLLFAFHPARMSDVVHPYIWDDAWLVLGLLFAQRLFASGRWRHAVGLALCGALQIGGSLYPLAGGAALALPILVWLAWQYGFRALRPGPVLMALAGVGLAAAFVFSPYLALTQSGVLAPRFQLFLPWSDLLPGRQLFPGWILLGLALAGLALAPRRGAPDPRWALLAGALLAAYLAAGGTAGQGALAIARGETPGWSLPNLYTLLAALVPGLEIVRAPSNLYTGAQLALCILAGLGAAALLRLAPPRAARPAAVALLTASAIAALRPPLPGLDPAPRLVAVRLAPDPERIAFYQRLAERGNQGPILDLPYQPRNARAASSAVLLSAYHHRRTAACWVSRWPDEVEQIRRLALRLPDAAAARELRALGFTTLVRHADPERPGAARWASPRLGRLSAGTLREVLEMDGLAAWEIVDEAS